MFPLDDVMMIAVNSDPTHTPCGKSLGEATSNSKWKQRDEEHTANCDTEKEFHSTWFFSKGCQKYLFDLQLYSALEFHFRKKYSLSE